MALTSEQVAKFREKGYIKYHNILDNDEVVLLRKEYEDLFEAAAKSGESRNLSVPGGLLNGDAQSENERQVFQLMQLVSRSVRFGELARDPRILDVVADLIGPEIQMYGDQALWKPPKTGGEVFWHQDNSYWRLEPPDVVSCWITLDDVVKESGAMELLGGMHFTELEYTVQEDTASLKKADLQGDLEGEVIELEAGGCMFHHCLAPHRTAPNTTSHHRRAVAFHYMRPGTSRDGKPLPESLDRPVVRTSA